MNFRQSIIIVELWRPEVARCWKKINFFAFFLENRPLTEKFFKNSVPKIFIATPIDVLFSNFVKFGSQEIGKVVRYLPDKKKHKTLPGCPALATAWIAPKIWQGRTSARQCTQRAPDFIQMVHFWQSYIHTREHHQSALQSESNIRLKPSFEPNNQIVFISSPFIY